MKSSKQRLAGRKALTLIVRATLVCSTALICCAAQTGRRIARGLELLVAVKADAPQLDRFVEKTIAVMRQRCEALGVTCEFRREDGDGGRGRIGVRVVGSFERVRVREVLLASGMEMRAVVSPLSPVPLKVYQTREEAEASAGALLDVLPYAPPDGKTGFVVVERAAIVTGDDVLYAGVSYITDEIIDVNFTLKPKGAARLKAWSGANIRHYIAVVMNGRVRTAPFIKSEISDHGQISGAFTRRQAEDTARILRSGNLPAPLEVLKEEAYDLDGLAATASSR